MDLHLFTETWLKEQHVIERADSAELSLPSYMFKDAPRQERQGGGTAFLAHCNLALTLL